ncbi:MAG: prepilin-type N-terminal cleavage/methylation domain-containing protein [Desulfitobacteriaceae bacterium]|nr:prepilin-type N-terminal cleavage/methylation domain-containing protein [Desulfitobacteriaceae bacterium]
MNDQGFTLLEFILSITLFSIIFVAVAGLVYSGFVSWQHGIDEIDTEQNVRLAMERIIEDVREAAVITLPRNLEEPVSSIEMKVPGNDLKTMLIVQYRYDRVGKEIERNMQPIASKISGFLISYTEYPPVIKIIVLGQRNNGSVISLRSKVMPRAVIR